MARTKELMKMTLNVRPRIRSIPVPQSVRKGGKPGPAKGSFICAVFAGQSFPVSPVLDTLYWFMAERHKVHQQRLAGEDPPWSEDDLINSYPFTNVFRVYDRTTQYILRHVIMKGSQDLQEVCFRVFLFRFFNRTDTWEHLEDHFGTPTLKWSEFNVEAYDNVLTDFAASTPLYSGAYISPAPSFGWPKNHSNHLRLLQVMMDDDLPVKLKELQHLKDAHGFIRLYPSIGDFIGQQILLDLNMTTHFKWSEQEWAALGPGSSACLRKIFGPSVTRHEQAALRYLWESQMSHFTRLGITKSQVPRLCRARPAGVSAVDIEHALCECEKYCRGRFPHIKGKRTQVGRPYRRSPVPITADLPAHWMDPLPNVTLPPQPGVVYDADGVPLYEVSHIVAEKPRYYHSGSGGGEGMGQYLVRWVGYGPEDDWWQSKEELEENSPNLLKVWTRNKERIAERIAHIRR